MTHEWEYVAFGRLKQCRQCGITMHTEIPDSELRPCKGASHQHDVETLYPGNRFRCTKCKATCSEGEVLPDVCRPTEEHGEWWQWWQWWRHNRDLGREMREAEEAALRKPGAIELLGIPSASAIRERAEALLGTSLDDRTLVEQLCDEVERLRAGAVAELDAENARLRADVADLHRGADLMQDTIREQATQIALLKRELGRDQPQDNVTRVTPFPEVEARSTSWPAPSHRPRMLP